MAPKDRMLYGLDETWSGLKKFGSGFKDDTLDGYHRFKKVFDILEPAVLPLITLEFMYEKAPDYAPKIAQKTIDGYLYLTDTLTLPTSDFIANDPSGAGEALSTLYIGLAVVGGAAYAAYKTRALDKWVRTIKEFRDKRRSK